MTQENPDTDSTGDVTAPIGEGQQSLDDTPWNYIFSGFIRESVSDYQRRTGLKTRTNDITSATRARLQMDLTHGNFRMYASGNLDFIWTNHHDSYLYPYLFESHVRNRLISAERIWREDGYTARMDLHRFYFAYRSDVWDITAGRHATSWGVGRFLNPMDLITPVGILVQDIEDIPGADLLSVTRYFGPYDSLQVVVVPHTRDEERNLSKLQSEDADLLIRYKGTFGTTDLVFLAGRHYRSYVAGFEANATLWDASFRFAYLGRREDPEFHKDPIAQHPIHQVVMGTGYAFFGALRLNAEFFYNSGHHDGEPTITQAQSREAQIATDQIEPCCDKDFSFFRTNGRLLLKNPYFFQFSASYEITTTIAGTAFFIYDIRGKSMIYGPQLSYGFSDEGIMALGARLYAYGQDRSRAEFAYGDPQFFFFLRWHFSLLEKS